MLAPAYTRNTSMSVWVWGMALVDREPSFNDSSRTITGHTHIMYLFAAHPGRVCMFVGCSQLPIDVLISEPRGCVVQTCQRQESRCKIGIKASKSTTRVRRTCLHARNSSFTSLSYCLQNNSTLRHSLAYFCTKTVLTRTVIVLGRVSGMQ